MPLLLMLMLILKPLLLLMRMLTRMPLLLMLTLMAVFAALALLLPVARDGQVRPHPKWAMPLAAAPLGYLAGLVAIGGGIFLAPLLHLTRWDGARRIAATASLFILINSLAGLAGQLTKAGPDKFGAALAGSLPLLVAVVIGGQIGSFLALRHLPARVIRWLTAGLTGWVGLRLLLG